MTPVLLGATKELSKMFDLTPKSGNPYMANMPGLPWDKPVSGYGYDTKSGLKLPNIAPSDTGPLPALRPHGNMPIPLPPPPPFHWRQDR